MSPALRVFAVWTLGLAILAAGASAVVSHTTETWFSNDVALRARLAVGIARRPLLSALAAGDDASLRAQLTEIARDERILAAAICGPDLRQRAATAAYPASLDCRALGARAGYPSPSPQTLSLRSALSLPEGDMELDIVPLDEHGWDAGFVAMLHDLRFARRRERATQRFLLISFAVLAALASLFTLAGTRLLRRRWGTSLREAALGGSLRRPELVPLIGDLRALIDRVLREERAESPEGRWSPERLRLTLRSHLHGERLIVAANREPYIHVRDGCGDIRVLHPASGLVSALEPVMRACSGVWIAHGSGSADREVVDARDHVRVPPGEESYLIRRLWLSEQEEAGYYYGLANEGLWPLCHVAHTRPTFRIDDWEQYRAINRRFADAICAEADSDEPVVLVQDYHLALVPALVRERLPRATILTFWHIPWPNAEQISICPWRNELIEGLLGSSILGFHTQFHCNNFLDAADRFLEARLDREEFAVVRNGRSTLVRAYPISIEWPNRWAGKAPPAAECRAALLAELGLHGDARLAVGVDRLDYTKGIEERFRAVERLLEREPEWIGRFCFVQIASPSRTLIERYQQLERDVERLAERINGRFARDGWRPIELRRRHTQPADIFALYRAADICYVSSLHDGMNLVAKEYIAARDDEQGVLLLSQFAGAARELAEAMIVNPYDIEQAGAALAAALRMTPDEQRVRMRAMREQVAEQNVYRWAGRMLLDASRLRRRERLFGQFPAVTGNAA